MRSHLAALTALFSVACATAQLGGGENAWPAGAAPAPRTALERLVSAHLEFLSSDEMGGRDTATVEGDITARYVAAEFRRLGLEPAGTDGYLQHYPLVRSRLLVESCALSVEGGSSFEHGEQYLVRGAADFDLTAPVAWGGWGIVEDSLGIDDLDGLDLEGRMVLMLYGAPEGRSELDGAASWSLKMENALERGAKGVVFVMPAEDASSNRIWGWVKRSQDRESLSLGPRDDSGATPRLFVRDAVAEELFAAVGLDWAAALAAEQEDPATPGRLLEGPQLNFAAQLEVEELQAANVVGLLRGSDPELADEAIVLSAHMDHVGKDHGEIHNGADDNASGTTAVMSVAAQLARDPEGLGRSVVFLAVSGEEKGLLGSEWFVDNPTLPIESIVANVNIDMVGRNDPGAIGATPSPDHPAYNTLSERAVGAGAEVGLKVEWEAGEGKYRKPVDTYYARSDHMHFSQAGIPVVFFFSGEHEDYHKPTDTLEKIDQAKVVKVVKMVEGLVRDVADDAQPPSELVE